jgi:CheY-like chemotaxis protein/HPt (histidine-containing phosphotransfer) domain-containing protein
VPITLDQKGLVSRESRILLAEDNPVNQAVAMAMLKKLGYHADLVCNGVEAVEALAKADYDVVLMDCFMPELDGYEATRRIRAVDTGTRNPRIPIIAVTADSMPGDRERCLQSGMNDYIPKPIELQKLSEILEKWLVALPNTEQAETAPTRPAARTEAVFVQEEMLARLMGDKELAGKVIAGFLSDTPRQLLLLKTKLEEGDAKGVKIIAHSLKGAAATLSAEALRAVCFELQEEAAGSELGNAELLLPQVKEQFEVLKRALHEGGWD